MIDETSHPTEFRDFSFPMTHQRSGTDDQCRWYRGEFRRIKDCFVFDRIHTQLKKGDRRDSLPQSRETDKQLSRIIFQRGCSPHIVGENS